MQYGVFVPFPYLSKRIAISFVADFPIIICSLRFASWSQDFYARQTDANFTGERN
jgi:hypothetical protein